MAYQINRAQVAEMASKFQRAMARARNITEKSEETIGQVIQSAEIQASAFTAGVVKGRFGSIEIVGVPADLGAAVGGHVLAFFGGGKYKEHIHNLSDGVLASYMTALGAGIGARMAVEAARAAGTAAPASGTTSAGHELSAGAERLSDAELRTLQAAGLRPR